MAAVAEKDEPNETQKAARRRLGSLPARSNRRQPSVKEMRAREASRVSSLLTRDTPAPPKKNKKGAPVQTALDPTPEWLTRYENACRKDSPTTASGYKMSERPVYRRDPWFESLVKRDDAFSDDD